MKLAPFLLLLALAPGAAGSVRLVTTDGQIAQPYQRWAQQSAMPTPDVAATVENSGCSLGGGPTPCTQIEYAPDSDIPDGQFTMFLPRRATTHLGFWHELGHIVNALLSPGDRAMIMRIERLRSWAGNGFVGYSAEELAAESYALCSDAHRRSLLTGHRYEGAYGTVTTRQLHKACGFYRAVLTGRN